MRTATFQAIVTLACCASASAFPRNFAREASNKQPDGGVLIVPPPPSPANRGIKKIPDADHPFRAPGPNDQRGPCPGLNTMANHGYIPRNGIASFEDMVNASGEAFNLDAGLASALAALGMLARGNAFLDLLSIGGQSPDVPPLPGHIDGPVALGLATHGRFEGDVSMTRQDKAIGDNRNFQDSLYDEFLLAVGQWGGDSPVTGNRSIVTEKVVQEFKYTRFVEDQIKNPDLVYHAGRFTVSYFESAFVLHFFRNGTDKTLTVPTMGSFLRNQTFPENWHRQDKPGNFSTITNVAIDILNAHPVWPGVNDANGNYVLDPNINLDNLGCASYDNFVQQNLASTLVNTTGTLKKNVNTLLNAMFVTLGTGCDEVQPGGPPGV